MFLPWLISEGMLRLSERKDHGMISRSFYLPIRASPYQHQKEAARFALARLEDGGGAALLMEMGTGKTLTSIAITGALRNAGRDRKSVV